MLRSHLALGLALTAVIAAAAPAAQAQDRYALANGCYGLKSLSTGSFVAKTADGGYAANADRRRPSAFRMQATDLGRYLLYGKDRDFLANGTPEPVDSLPLPALPAGSPASGSRPRRRPSESADWRVNAADGAFLALAGPPERVLAAGDGGTLVQATRRGGRPRAVRLRAARRLRRLPRGRDQRDRRARPAAPTAYGEVTGMVDAHMHMMAFEFLGGRSTAAARGTASARRARCTTAPTTSRTGIGAVGENTLSYGNPVGTHDTRGWPIAQGLAAPRVAHARADLLQVGRALVARRACGCS